MLRKLCFILALTLIYTNLLNASSKMNETVVVQIGDEKISSTMLEDAYNKNIGKNRTGLFELDRDSIDNFLNMFINYRLKVHDAINKGLLNDPDVINDIETNRRILAESFFFEQNLTRPYVKQSVERREKEIEVAIILKSFAQKKPETKEEAESIASNVMKQLKDGADFATLARKMSDDKITASYGGVVPGRITAGNVQREIEEATFNTPVGEIYPELIETRYGFIILKVLSEDKRELVYSSHILFSHGIESDSASVYNRADSVLTLLNKGGDFAKLAKEVSDDDATARYGGSFDSPYSRSTGLEPSGKPFLPEYEEGLFSLKDGEFSDIVATEFGLHIIKRDSTIDFNRELERRALESSYKRTYYNIDKNEFMDSLTEAYGMNINMDVLQNVITYLDTSFASRSKFGSEIPNDLLSTDIYSFLGVTYSVEDYMNQMNSEQAVYGFGIDKEGLKKSIYVMNRSKVIDKATANLENEYPEFKKIINEFRDGILLFKAEAEEVWNKMQFDTSLARQYYNNLDKEILTKKEYDISEIFLTDENEAKDIWDNIQKGGDFDKFATEYTMRQGFREKAGSWGTLVVGKDFFADKADEKNSKAGDVLKPFKYQNGWSIIKINKVHPPRKKTFEEAISDIAPAVQDIQQKNLTEKWLDSIKADTKITIYEKEIDKIINNKR